MAPVSPPAVIFGLLFLGAGLLVVALGVRSLYRAGRRIFTSAHVSVTDPVSPEEIPDSGHAVVTGTVEAGPSGIVSTPFSARDAVAHSYAMQQQTDGVGWWRVIDGEHAEPFVVRDSVSRVRVDPNSQALELATEPTENVPADGTLSTATQESLAAASLVESDGEKVRAAAVDEPRRYEEGLLESGDTVYVYGAVTNEDKAKRIDAEASREFIVSRDPIEGITDDEPEETLTTVGDLLGGIIGIVMGVLFAGLGVSLLLDGLGVVIG